MSVGLGLLLLLGLGAPSCQRRQLDSDGSLRPANSLKRPDVASTIGADCPWDVYPVAAGKTNAWIHGPSREYLTPESESTGRQFVKLESAGQFVEFKVVHPANTIVVRFCIPDAPNGGGLEATLGLYVNGKPERRLQLSSRYSWSYGDFPWSNDPKKGRCHHFFDETHALICPVSPGDVIRLQKDHADQAAYYLIDRIELEQIAPPLPRPADTLSIVDFGAVPNSQSDCSHALTQCLAAARVQGKTVWIPQGEFRLNGERIPIGGVKVRGAGMWYSVLGGASPMFEGTGTPVEFSDLSIFGSIDRRNDDSPDNAFNGNLGRGSMFCRLWIEHLKCGFWTTHGTESMRVEHCRIRNTMADGLNFCDGTRDSVVEQCHLRNTGDDALATWSPSGNWSSKTACAKNRFVHNTIELPWHANGIGIYGGADHLIAHNRVIGTVFSGGGILISSGFEAVPFSGTIRVKDNSITDAGGQCYIGEPVGGLWIHAKDSDIEAAIVVNGLRISQCPASAVTLHGPKKAMNVSLTNLALSDAAGYGIDIKGNAGGLLRLSNAQIRDARLGPLHNGSEGTVAVVGGL